MDGEPQSERANFGQCVEKVAVLLSENESSVIIVEAPLSGLFDSSGNPKGRTPFEKSKIGGQTETRYWYVGPGAAVGLGAAFFFSRLLQKSSLDSVMVNVIEGFISFKTQHSDDVEDALALLSGFHNPDVAIHDIGAEPGERCVNMLSLVGLDSQEAHCPTVMALIV